MDDTQWLHLHIETGSTTVEVTVPLRVRDGRIEVARQDVSALEDWAGKWAPSSMQVTITDEP